MLEVPLGTPSRPLGRGRGAAADRFGRVPLGGGAGPPKFRGSEGAAGAMRARGSRVALCGLTLLCALGLGHRAAGGPSCGPGRHLRGTGTDARCCRSCAPGKAPSPRATCSAPCPCSDPARGGGRQAFRVQSPGSQSSLAGGGGARSSQASGPRRRQGPGLRDPFPRPCWGPEVEEGCPGSY